jgi:hypothetical protein
MRSAMDSGSSGAMTKSLNDPTQDLLKGFLAGPSAQALAKEWTLSTPINTGLVAYDLSFRVAAW